MSMARRDALQAAISFTDWLSSLSSSNYLSRVVERSAELERLWSLFPIDLDLDLLTLLLCLFFAYWMILGKKLCFGDLLLGGERLFVFRLGLSISLNFRVVLIDIWLEKSSAKLCGLIKLGFFLLWFGNRWFFWERSGFPNGFEYLESGVSFKGFGKRESFSGDGLLPFLLGAFLIFSAGSSPIFFGVDNLFGVFTCD